MNTEPSKLGYGCMRFPQTADEKINEPAAASLLEKAYRSGITYFDTAYPYHHGQSQEFTARVLRQFPRASYNLANKLPLYLIKTKDDVARYFNEQLEICKVDHFDYYLAHAVGDERWEKVIVPFDVFQQLLQFKKEGKIRHLGFSFHGSAACLEKAVSTCKWDFVQIQLNYFDWYYQDAARLYQILRNAGLPIIVMEPVRGGALAALCPKALQIIHDSGYKGSPASLALRYAASLEGVQTVLSGMSTEDQLDDNLATFKSFKPLSEDELALVEKVRVAYLDSCGIPCTGCQYCQPCPNGVLIPKVFAAYNSYAHTQDIAEFKKQFSSIKSDEGPRSCIECGKCVKLCPQAIEIPKKLKMIGEFASHHI
ncbi:MAG: aldo/keto reductase [Sphaerochaetaceae bacterium]|jgi:predicted aldo/keto reductase-like oxidoreductase|nr:aldo/keto reductase [Sphaerochaetaceae bacterium]MDD3163692.1 aldo/keto reductase [Sphaerochaetaceae bacterium]MDD4007895.1 aldo/keto reductase [Sphaerochaetaceae bacterium]MDD4397123.1 aldo/keto reductase [Sphaerochaetaceae bacterium]